MVGTDFPYKEFYPDGKVVVQVDTLGEHIGRRHPVDHAIVGDARLTLEALLPLLEHRTDRSLLAEHAVVVRRLARAPAAAHRPRLRAPAARPPAPHGGEPRRTGCGPSCSPRRSTGYAADDAVFTVDTGMATTWLARFVRMTGRRELLGSFNLGSMANAMPQALGAQALDRGRQVVACCGDGGLTMLLGDLLTAVAHDLPVKLVVFDNGSLGMVKLEMEQAGLAAYGTALANPDLVRVAEAVGMRGIRVEDPHDVDAAVADAFAHDGPVLLDVLTNPDEIAAPPKPTLQQGWGFAIAKTKEFLESSD